MAIILYINYIALQLFILLVKVNNNDKRKLSHRFSLIGASLIEYKSLQVLVCHESSL